MDKTVNINISGTLFQIDEDAFKVLRDYLNALNSRFRNVQGGHETIEDIESRIAEIFQSQKGLAGLITKENVESMISVIGRPEDFDHEETHEEQPSYSYQKKRMYRNPDDTIVGGVCGGIGAYLNADPVLFRILFVIFTFFGIGLFVYIVMWIALPVARTEAQKREMYGNAYYSVSSVGKGRRNSTSDTSSTYNSGYYNSSGIGNAFNEIFRAIGRVCWVIIRIFMIILGIFFVIIGFLILVSILMVIFFKFPSVFTPDGVTVHFTYIQDFLKYIVSPSTVPWITVLSVLVLAIPMLALIYGGIKMIFWFKVKDGIYALAGFVIWIIAGAALTMLIFNEGISFAETGRSSTQTFFTEKPDTLYIITTKNVSRNQDFKEFSVPDEDYTLLMNDSLHQLWMPANLRLNITNNSTSKVEIRRQSSARKQSEAVRKAESSVYNYRLSNDTLYLDEFFTLPAGSRWTADLIRVNLFVPENTVLYFSNETERMFSNDIMIGKFEDDEYGETHYDNDTRPWELGGKYWIITEDGLEKTERATLKKK